MGYLFLAFIIALLTTLIFSARLKTRGPWWFFFLIILFAAWAGALWINPVGPALWGVAWIPAVITALVFALILAAVESEKPGKEVAGQGVTTNGRGSPAVAGTFFWFLLVLLLIVIILGYSF